MNFEPRKRREMIKSDCIFFEESEKDTGMKHCTKSGSLDQDGDLCRECRLWDSYIPNTATEVQVEKAVRWQDMSLDEQLDYDEYFLDPGKEEK